MNWSDSSIFNPTIPFLPLDPTFDSFSKASWQDLSCRIEHWLTVIGLQSPDWTWGCEAFWMAFVASYPSFPCGSWPEWNVAIPFAGPFIMSWIEDPEFPNSGDSSRVGDNYDSWSLVAVEEAYIMSSIWLHFQSLISTVWPYEII
jgi:hypothetical protein